MPGFSSPAIILRRTAYAEYDTVLDLLTLERGRITAMAKNARKSKKRFAGILEPFCCLEAVFADSSVRSGMTILREAAVSAPFGAIRLNMEKVAYASYWSEMVNRWVKEDDTQADLFHLLHYVLFMLDSGNASHADLSILFQIRFMTLAGLFPGMTACRVCKTEIDRLSGSPTLYFDIATGGIVCPRCGGDGVGSQYRKPLSRGLVKQFLWVRESKLPQAERMRFTATAREQGLAALEAFVAYHLAMEIKSLKVLQRIRHR